MSAQNFALSLPAKVSDALAAADGLCVAENSGLVLATAGSKIVGVVDQDGQASGYGPVKVVVCGLVQARAGDVIAANVALEVDATSRLVTATAVGKGTSTGGKRVVAWSMTAAAAAGDLFWVLVAPSMWTLDTDTVA